jgi:hypothetical protein
MPDDAVDLARKVFLRPAAERALAAVKAARAGGRVDRMAIRRATLDYHAALGEAMRRYPRDLTPRSVTSGSGFWEGRARRR